ncbi:hypothetical protein BGZ68_009635 [Mortierella alpina]|nr:hypothetical protein BGZ68_009635 [Mortierella alpina]
MAGVFSEPFLWSTIVLDDREEYSSRLLPKINALKRYGHLVKHAELHSWDSQDICSKRATPEGNDLLLTETLLAQCGSNLASLHVVDPSINGRIWRTFMERIHNNRALEGAKLLNRIRALDISLSYNGLDLAFQPILVQPNRNPEAAALFAEVKELRLCRKEASPVGLTWEEELCYDSLSDAEEEWSTTFQELVTLFPSLDKLTLVNIDIDDDSDIDEVEEESVAVTTTRPDYPFHTLNFQECCISSRQIIRILRRTRNIQSLKIGINTSLMGGLEVLIGSLPTLTPFLTEYVQECIHFSDWSTVLRGLPCLTRLHIAADAQLGDDALEALAKSCSKLEHLQLHYCKSLTYRGLHHILRSCAQLKSLKLPMTPVQWDIFECDSELRCSSTTAPSTTTTAPSPPTAFIPWACQDTLQELLLTLLEDNFQEHLFAARQRFQSLSRLRELELRGQKLPVTMLMDLEHQHPSNGPPNALYPALKELIVQHIYPPVTLDNTIKLVRSMPNVTRIRSADGFHVSFDIRSLQWLAENNKLGLQ